MELQEGYVMASMVYVIFLVCTILIMTVFRVSHGKLIVPIENSSGSLANIKSSSSSIMPL
jgi:hypothetical protein